MNLLCLSKHARAALSLVEGPNLANPRAVHDACNDLLGRLRSGSRRARYQDLRCQLRELRAKAARRLAARP